MTPNVPLDALILLAEARDRLLRSLALIEHEETRDDVLDALKIVRDVDSFLRQPAERA